MLLDEKVLNFNELLKNQYYLSVKANEAYSMIVANRPPNQVSQPA
jgi:hypothetical protein